jgi:hypothetical protein
VRTPWNSTDIWLRKWFDIDVESTESIRLALEIQHSAECELYLNGQLIYGAVDGTVDYQRIELDERSREALQPGRNVVAVHCRDQDAQRYFDAGLLQVLSNPDKRSALEQFGVALLGKQGLEELATLREQLAKSKRTKPPPSGTPIMSVSQRDGGPVHVLVRGNPHAKGDLVEPGVPAALGTEPPVVRPCSNRLGTTSGKRLALARWLFQPDNPLTARVIANRIWQHHFGRGIVPTTNDFGKLGEPPTHPQLLDWLACEIRNGGWKLKRIHKQILLSNTWQMSSQADDRQLAADPANRLFWRFNMRRLASEEVRDSMLAVTGELNLQQGGPSIYVPIAQEVLQGQSRPGAGWGTSSSAQAARRSIYIHVKRSLLVPILEMHDQADTDSSCPVRYVTTVPTQALGMLNGPFTQKRAQQLAERLQNEVPGDRQQQVRRAIRLTTGRRPSNVEVADDLQLLASLEQRHGLARERALQVYCLLVLNTNEFVYLD